MQMTGSQLLPVPRDVAWAALNDPAQLKAALTGCNKFERQEDGKFTVVMTAAVGPVKAKFNSVVTLTDVIEPESYAMTFDGQGGVAGFGRGTANVSLVEELDSYKNKQTRLNYSVNAQVGGKLAQIGQRLIDATAKKMADDFFTRFSKTLAASVDVNTNGGFTRQTNSVHTVTPILQTQPQGKDTSTSMVKSSSWPLYATFAMIVFLIMLGALTR
jgi:uncharacterized protein